MRWNGEPVHSEDCGMCTIHPWGEAAAATASQIPKDTPPPHALPPYLTCEPILFREVHRRLPRPRPRPRLPRPLLLALRRRRRRLAACWLLSHRLTSSSWLLWLSRCTTPRPRPWLPQLPRRPLLLLRRRLLLLPCRFCCWGVGLPGEHSQHTNAWGGEIRTTCSIFNHRVAPPPPTHSSPSVDVSPVLPKEPILSGR